jgi:hypothetical protein
MFPRLTIRIIDKILIVLSLVKPRLIWLRAYISKRPYNGAKYQGKIKVLPKIHDTSIAKEAPRKIRENNLFLLIFLSVNN